MTMKSLLQSILIFVESRSIGRLFVKLNVKPFKKPSLKLRILFMVF